MLRAVVHAPFLTCEMRLCRRKTTAEKKAEAARKAEMLQEVDTSAPYSLQQRQPWASKVAEVSFWAAWLRHPASVAGLLTSGMTEASLPSC